MSNMKKNNDIIKLKKRFKVYSTMISSLSSILLVYEIISVVCNIYYKNNPISGQDLRGVGLLYGLLLIFASIGIADIVFIICLSITRKKLSNRSINIPIWQYVLSFVIALMMVPVVLMLTFSR